jgi:hypothetical protein
MATPQLQKEINAAYFNAFGRNANAGEMKYYGERGMNLLNKNLRADKHAKGVFEQYRKDKANPVAPVDPNQALIDAITKSLYPETTPPPSFEDSGLYNEADIIAQANADYQPTFLTEQQKLQAQQQDALRGLSQTQDVNQRNLEEGYNQSLKGLTEQQQQQKNSQLSDYYNRGLSKAGAFQGAQQYLGQNQAYDTNLLNQDKTYKTNLFNQNKAYDTNYLTTNQGYDTQALGQQQLSTLAGVKSNAYNQAFQRYLAQFNTK